MTPATPPQPFDPESLRLLTTEQLINIILEQQRLLEQLSQEVAQLKVSLHLDSQTSSIPPSTDLLKKPEQAKQQLENTGSEPKRRPGGQPGHEGKTRKGNGLVDRVANPATRNLPQLWQPGV